MKTETDNEEMSIIDLKMKFRKAIQLACSELDQHIQIGMGNTKMLNPENLVDITGDGLFIEYILNRPQYGPLGPGTFYIIDNSIDKLLDLCNIEPGAVTWKEKAYKKVSPPPRDNIWNWTPTQWTIWLRIHIQDWKIRMCDSAQMDSINRMLKTGVWSAYINCHHQSRSLLYRPGEEVYNREQKGVRFKWNRKKVCEEKVTIKPSRYRYFFITSYRTTSDMGMFRLLRSDGAIVSSATILKIL